MMKWIDEVGAALSALGTSSPIVGGGFIGALLSLRFLSPESTVVFRLTMVLGGFMSSLLLVPLIVSVLNIQGVNILAGVAFIVGLYGMSIISELNELIKSGALQDAVKRVINK